jgi:hypothetical protein
MIYNKKYKALKKETDEDIRKWKASHFHGLAELIL